MWKEKIDQAADLIQGEVWQTPLEHSIALSKLIGADIYLKLENQQQTGSFKLRGVMNKILGLDSSQVKKGLVACSTGNHGAAFAHAVDKFGYEGLLFLPENVAQAKLDALRNYNLELSFFGDDCVKTEVHARQYAEERGQVLVHPYNDVEIVCGQGTIAREIILQLSTSPDYVIAPVGGGGLISGIAAYMQGYNGVEVLGCQPVNSAVMKASLEAGEILDMDSKETLSDATAGGIEQGSITFDICKEYVNEILLCTEEEIRAAIGMFINHHQMIVEGAAAMTLATVMKNSDRFQGKKIVLVLSGKKISKEVLKGCLS